MNFQAQSFADAIDNYLTALTPFGYSGAVLVAKGETVLLRNGYGLADRTQQQANTADTIFSLGSITKQFTAAAVMKLVQTGQLSTEDRLDQHITGVPDDKATITIHQLLNHTAGIINYSGDDYEPAQAEELLETVLRTPLEFEPGSSYAYSNAGYSLLAYIVEQVARIPYEQFLYETLLKPAGLEKTGYSRPDWSEQNVARWYVGEKDNGHALEKHYPSWNIMGNGEMLSTLDDMLQWHNALHSDDLLGREIKQQMYIPGMYDYGYGWRIVETALGQLIEHNGASALGSSALFRRYVDAGLTIVLFCNQSYGQLPFVLPLEQVIDQLIRGEVISLPPLFNTELVSMNLHQHEGRYPVGMSGYINVVSTGTHLILKAEGQEALNRVFFPDHPLSSYEQLNQRTVSAVTEFIDGNDNLLRSFLNEPERRYKGVANLLHNHMVEAEKFLGVYQGTELIGTIPSSYIPEALDTAMAVRFRNGGITVISISRDGINIGFLILEDIQEVVIPSVPTSGGELTGYHLPLSYTARIRLEKQPN